MGAKITFDATNRKFVVTQAPDPQGFIYIDLQVDLYSDAKEDWQDSATYPDLGKMQFPIDAIGGNPFGAQTLGISYLIKHGWSFKPYEADHTMVLIGNIGTETGWELVDDTVGAYRVRVENEVSSIVSLENLSFIEGAAYQGEVVVDLNNGQAGTQYPIGSRSTPVDNFTDAITIAESKGLGTVVLAHSMTLTSDALLDGYSIRGGSPTTTTATIDVTSSTVGSEFQTLTAQGIAGGANVFNGCNTGDLYNVSGTFLNCGFGGTITLAGSQQTTIIDCYSIVAGGSSGATPTINMGGSGNTLAVRDYHGGLEITNSTGPGDHSLDISSGRIIFDSTVSDGDFYVRGIGTVTDNSTGTANVYDLTLTADTSRARKLLSNRQELVDTGTDVRMRTWDDDGTTVLEENIVKDPNDNDPDLVAGTTTKRGVSQ